MTPIHFTQQKSHATSTAIHATTQWQRDGLCQIQLWLPRGDLAKRFANQPAEIRRKVLAIIASRMAANKPAGSNAQLTLYSRDPVPPPAPPPVPKRPRGRPRTRFHPYAGRTTHHLPAQPHAQLHAQQPPVTTPTAVDASQTASGLNGAAVPVQQQLLATASAPLLSAQPPALPTAPASLPPPSYQGHQYYASQQQSSLPTATAPRSQTPPNHDLPSTLARPRVTTPPSPETPRAQYQDTDFFEPRPICDEDPAFFSGTTDIVRAHELCQLHPPSHSLPVRACSNTSAHANGPHRVCEGCHQRGDKHLRATTPKLLCKNYVPLCKNCAEDAVDRNQRRNGFVEDCVCFRASEDNWLCFDCRESSLMMAKGCWDAETLESKRTPSRQCRCGADLDNEMADGLPVRVYMCVTCEGIHTPI